MLESLAVPAGYEPAGIMAPLESVGQDELPGMPRQWNGWIPQIEIRSL